MKGQCEGSISKVNVKGQCLERIVESMIIENFYT